AASGETSSGPVVNLVVGYELFQHHVQRALGRQPAALDPNDPAHRCETVDGIVIDPHDMLVAAALGHIRRIVLDSAGVAVDVGRKQRLFTGPMRDAVIIGNRRCIWPGCQRPATQCQADHLLPYANAGPTATYNGGPACDPHNRWKTRGYRTWRDPTGQWHHYRPDNTEIGWRAAA
ncbi:MAG: HNH endonuclease, partial [Actinobacteria bacterium]|nr:HNH endonuclease [Actinomycetota bacterium]